MMFEFRSRKVTVNDEWQKPDLVEQTCNEWAAEGFEVFSVICPQPSNYNTFRLTAKRLVAEPLHKTGRKFR
jgi:hypothetical protein